RGAVEVGAEGDVVDPRLLGDVVDVPDDVGDRRLRVEAAVGPEHRDAERDADDAAGRGDRAQLLVRQVPRGRADGVRVRVGRDDRSAGSAKDAAETARVEVRDVERDAEPRT